MGSFGHELCPTHRARFSPAGLGQLWSWGTGRFGELGTGLPYSVLPRIVPFPANTAIASVTAGPCRSIPLLAGC